MNATYFPHRRTETPLPSAVGATAASQAEERAEPTWARPALIALLVCTAVAYLLDLSASGYANSFYAAAVQAGTKSWKAMFFGSIDSSNFITVDKPPASLWVMELSGRIFGFSGISMLIPQVLEGVATVALLHAAVKRWFGSSAGLAAGALLAITPVAALMFRFNNPDALLVCLLVAGAYCLVRAVEGASTRWVIAAGTMIGFAFLAKMMQAFLVLPAFGVVYLVATPTTLPRRLWQMLTGVAAIVVSCGWWVAIVALWPVGSRPMIDGSPDNNIFNLIFGYNGLGRIFGAGGPGGGGANFSGPTGLLRLFDSEMGAQASWLLPAAVLALIVGLWTSRCAPRTDRTRAALLLWGGWLLVSAVVFSFGSGVIHTYYTVALAPAIAALVAIGGVLLWRERHTLFARTVAALAIAVTASWSWVLLNRTPQWELWMRVLIPASAAIAVVGLLVAPVLRRFGRQVSIVTAILAVVACLSGPVAYSAQTITTAHTGSTPSAGPGSSMGGGPGAGAPSAKYAGAFGAPAAGSNPGADGFPRAGGSPGAGGFPGGASGAHPGSPGTAGSRLAGGIGGGASGQTDVSSALKQALEREASKFRWVAALPGSQSAASLELASAGKPVMAIGGFNNEGGNLTLAEFKRYVAAGDIHYYLASSGMGGAPGAGSRTRLGGTTGSRLGAIAGAGPGFGGSASSTSSITSWVEAHFKSVKIGGQNVYDLTQARS